MFPFRKEKYCAQGEMSSIVYSIVVLTCLRAHLQQRKCFVATRISHAILHVLY